MKGENPRVVHGVGRGRKRAWAHAWSSGHASRRAPGSEVCWIGPDRKLICIPLASWALDREIKQIVPGSERPPVCGEKALDKLQ